MIIIPISRPAANAEFTYTVPNGGVHWNVLGLTFRLVTDANAANRIVTVNFGDLYYVAGTVQPASITCDYYLRAFVSAKPADIVTGTRKYFVVIGEENLILTGAEVIVSSTANIQAGDRYGATIALLVETL